MRILIISASLPYPPASGGALRAYGIIQGLHAAGHSITLLTFAEGDVSGTPLDSFCERIEFVPPPHRSKIDRLRTMILSGRPDIEERLYSDAFRDKLLALLPQHDLVQFEGIEVGVYLPLAKAAGARTCFDTFNAEADLQRVIYEIDRGEFTRWPAAFYSWIQSKRISQYEGALCRAADLVIAVSEEDAALLRQYSGAAPVHVMPSGIFVDDYALPGGSVNLGERALVFTGKMDYRPNVDAMLWFAEQILPLVKNTNLTIVGQKPHARIRHLPEQENITLTGWVDSVLPYLHAASVYIAPLRMGSGTRLKILEAMASGCAIIATPAAAAGLSSEAQSALRIASSASGFAAAVNHLLDTPEQREKLSNEARRVVKEQYDWPVLIPRLLRAYEEVGLG